MRERGGGGWFVAIDAPRLLFYSISLSFSSDFRHAWSPTAKPTYCNHPQPFADDLTSLRSPSWVTCLIGHECLLDECPIYTIKCLKASHVPGSNGDLAYWRRSCDWFVSFHSFIDGLLETKKVLATSIIWLARLPLAVILHEPLALLDLLGKICFSF